MRFINLRDVPKQEVENPISNAIPLAHLARRVFNGSTGGLEVLADPLRRVTTRQRDSKNKNHPH